MRTNGRVDPAMAAAIFQHDVMQSLAHAVKALEFVGVIAHAHIARHVEHGGDCMGIVRGKLRIDAPSHAQKLFGIGDITDICCRLGCKHRKAFDAFNLRALYFGVPVSALYKADHDAAVKPLGQRVEIVDRVARALAIGLHNNAEAVPACERWLG